MPLCFDFRPGHTKAPPSMTKADFGFLSPGANRGACGVGVLVDLNANKTHQLVEDGLRILCNLDHRGARGAEEKTGDGAGMLLQKPHEFFRSEILALGEFDSYGVGQLFIPKD
jgi:glutamate synthase domain-containing protein 1